MIGGPAVFAGYVTDPDLGGPRVIEDALLTHPAVTAAAAVGRPDRHAPRTEALSFVSILSAHDVRLEDITDLVGTAARRSPRRSTVTRSSPPSPKTTPAVNRTLKANATEPACLRSGKAIGSPIGSRN